MNDDPSVLRSSRSTPLNFSASNLPAFQITRRTERLVPPTGFWNTYGVSKLFYIVEFFSSSNKRFLF